MICSLAAPDLDGVASKNQGRKAEARKAGDAFHPAALTCEL